MARPRKEGMEYFPHDTDAANDEKIEALRALHGNDGYVFYFVLLERIYRTSTAELDVSTPAILAALIKHIGVDRQKFDDMMNTAFQLKLFDQESYIENQIITSKGIKKRAIEVTAMRDRWRNKKAAAELSPELPDEFSRGKTEEETPESKAKQSKEKEKDILPPNPPEGENAKQVFQHWNSQDIIVHREMTDKILRKLKAALKARSPDEINQAISNYAEILKSDDYFFEYKWTLSDFIDRGLDKFFDREIAISNYQKRGDLGGQQRGSPQLSGPGSGKILSTEKGLQNPDGFSW